MKLTKDQFSNWEDENDKEYERIFDDELCISIDTKKYSSKDVADYILGIQEKLEKIKALDWHSVIKFTGTKRGDQHEVHNNILRKFTKILGDKS
jgi:hypothetical protein